MPVGKRGQCFKSNNFVFTKINGYFARWFSESISEEIIMRLIRKILVILIIIVPVVSTSDCKKQAKCGCDGDVLFSLASEPARVIYNTDGSSIHFTAVSNPYATYYFCNPGEMFPKLAESKSGDILLVSGHAYWNCNYLMNSGNSYYSMYYKAYEIFVTDVYSDLYGKK